MPMAESALVKKMKLKARRAAVVNAPRPENAWPWRGRPAGHRRSPWGFEVSVSV